MLRFFLACLVLPLGLLGCGGGHKFSVKQTLQADSSTDTASQTVLYDLSSVPEIAADKGKVSTLHLDDVVANITQLGAGNMATSMTISLSLRPQSAPTDGSKDAQLGSLGPIPLIAGVDGTIGGSKSVDDWLLGVLSSDNGRFYLLLSGTGDGPPHFTIDVTLNAEVSP